MTVPDQRGSAITQTGPPHPGPGVGLETPRNPGGHGAAAAGHAVGHRALSPAKPQGGAREPRRDRMVQNSATRSSRYGPKTRTRMVNDLERGRTGFQTDHQPDRPAWNCLECTHLWPCSSVRDQLLAYFADPHGDIQYSKVGAYLALHMSEAMPELPNQPSHKIHDRFVGWIRHERAARDRRRAAIARITEEQPPAPGGAS